MRNSLHEKVSLPIETSAACKSPEADILPQATFLRALTLERKRSERSHRRFVLMLLHAPSLVGSNKSPERLDKMLSAVSISIRETDIPGWYENGSTIGVIFTEIGTAPGDSIKKALRNKITKALASALHLKAIDEAALSFHIYPEDSDRQDPTPPWNPTLYPDLKQSAAANRASLNVKRAMDIAGSLIGLILCAPAFLVISILIKLTSKGPILFRQQRIGYHGAPFTFLKFRSMHFNNDHTIHREYVTQLIAAKATKATQKDSSTVYKLTGDPRVTKIGRFLRRTSLDELPQLINVLLGDMSLVGPRPPVPYEFAAYSTWHRNRLMAVKPGITGLWQVAGRSRVTFDEMVRLDLRYATSWSLWLDIIILLQTPRAVVTGQGAY